MGLFEFQCADGHVSEWRGPYKERPDVMPCQTPGCKEDAYSILSPVPTTFRANDRRAFKRHGK